jgi:acyl carrier protein
LLLVKRSLAKTSSGKLQRRACRDRFLNGDLAVLHMGRIDGPKRDDGRSVLPEDAEHPIPTEKEIREWLLDKLSKHTGALPEEIDPSKSFDTFGLDSHDAVEIVDAAKTWLGREVDGAVLYKYPTVDLLVRHLVEELSIPIDSSATDTISKNR